MTEDDNFENLGVDKHVEFSVLLCVIRCVQFSENSERFSGTQLAIEQFHRRVAEIAEMEFSDLQCSPGKSKVHSIEAVR